MRRPSPTGRAGEPTGPPQRRRGSAAAPGHCCGATATTRPTKDQRRAAPSSGRPTRSGARSISGTPQASTRSTASGRTLRHKPFTSRLIALERCDGEPAVLHEPGRGRPRSRTARTGRTAGPARPCCRRRAARATLSTNASSTSRSTCARAARDHVVLDWEKTWPGFILWSMPRLSRRATPASMCSSRNRSIASW